MRSSLITLTLLSLALPSVAAPSSPSAEPTLRIGLIKHFSHARSLLLSCDDSFAIQSTTTGHTLLHGSPNLVYEITVTPEGMQVMQDVAGGEAGALSQAAPITAMPTSGAGTLQIALAPPTVGDKPLHWYHYRGTFQIQREADGTLQVVNTVPLEQYLYGVIPAEIGSDAPAEAMKAQAVAARTYALKNRGKFAAEGFDLDDTTRSEGYDGVDGETPASNAAVDATQGLVLTWHGTLIDAPYSTDSGGMTACDTSGADPYLQAVRDAALPSGPDYAAADKYHTWTLTETPAQLQAALSRDPRTRVAQFQSLALDGFDASGRITKATVTGTDSTAKTVTGPQLREILGYNSLRSTLVTLTVLPDGDYQFTGKGWGHGLGMSQDGAIAMASAPYHDTYQNILSHYYVGTVLTPVTRIALPPAATEAEKITKMTHSQRGA